MRYSMMLLLILLGALIEARAVAQSAPQASASEAYKRLLDAIEHADVRAVAELIALPPKFSEQQRLLFARRVMLGSQLQWLVAEQFGEQNGRRIRNLAKLDTIL